MKWPKHMVLLASLIFAITVTITVANPLIPLDRNSDTLITLDNTVEPTIQYEPSAFTWYTDYLFSNVSAYLYDSTQMTIDAEFGDWALPNVSCSVHPKFYCDEIISATLHFRWDPDQYLLMAWVTIFDLNPIEPSSHGFLFALVVRYPDDYINAQQILVTDYEGRGYTTNFDAADYDESAQYPTLEIAYGLQRTLSPGDEIGIIAIYDDEFSGVQDAWPKYTDGGTGPDSVDTENMAKLILQPDYENPDVSITGPVNEGQTYYTTSSAATLNWDASDNYHIDYFDIEVDSSIIASGLSSSTTSYPLTGLGEGSHPVSVICYDESGRFDTSSITVVVDNTVPSVTITSPVNLYNSSSTSVDIYWTASDTLSWVDSQDIYLNDSLEHSGLSGSLDTYPLSLSPGYHNVTIVSWDEVGNRGKDSIFIRVDIVDPVVTFTTPPDSEYLSGSFVTVQWTILDATPSSEIQTTWIYLDEALNTTGSGKITQISWTLSEGMHNVTVVTMDYSGNIGSSERIFYVDLTNPLVEITHPPDGLILSNGSYTFTLTWTASDNLGIDYIEVWIESTLYTLSASAREYTPPTITETTAYTVKIFDLAGRISSDSVVVTFLSLDTTPPSLSITSHLNYSWDSSTILLQWTANDPESGVSSIHIRLDGDPVTDQTLPGASTQASLDLLTEGLHQINLTAVNGDGFSKTVILWINCDDTSPFVSILDPLDGLVLLEDELNASWAMHDNVSGTPGLIDRVEVYVDSSLEGITSNVWLILYSLDTGFHTLELRVYDEAGNMQMDSVDFWVDLAPPDITIVSPAADFLFDKQSVNEIIIRALVTDDTALSLVYVTLENETVLCINQSMTFNAVSGYWEFTWGLTAISPGIYNLTITGVDLAGRAAVRMISGEILHSSPPVDTSVPTLAITAPSNGSYFSSEFTIHWTSSDDQSGIAYVLILIDGLEQLNSTDSSDLHHVSGLDDGAYNVTVVACNGVGLKKSRSITVFIDSVNPTIQLLSPLEDQIFDSRSVAVSWTASDSLGAFGEVDYFKVYLDGVLIAEHRNYYHQLTSLSDGRHAIRIEVVDMAGNTAENSTSIWVDVGSPQITINSPEENFEWKKDVDGHLTISCTATDAAAVSEVIVEITGLNSDYSTTIDLVLNDVTGRWEAIWQLASVDYGTYLLNVTAYDMAGHGASSMRAGSIIEPSPLERVALFLTSPIVIVPTTIVTLIATAKKGPEWLQNRRIRQALKDYHAGKIDNAEFCQRTGLKWVEAEMLLMEKGIRVRYE